MLTPAEKAIDSMPEFKRAYAKAWWKWLTDVNAECPEAWDYGILYGAEFDIRTELSMYDTESGEMMGRIRE